MRDTKNMTESEIREALTNELSRLPYEKIVLVYDFIRHFLPALGNGVSQTSRTKGWEEERKKTSVSPKQKRKKSIRAYGALAPYDANLERIYAMIQNVLSTSKMEMLRMEAQETNSEIVDKCHFLIADFSAEAKKTAGVVEKAKYARSKNKVVLLVTDNADTIPPEWRKHWCAVYPQDQNRTQMIVFLKRLKKALDILAMHFDRKQAKIRRKRLENFAWENLDDEERKRFLDILDKKEPMQWIGDSVNVLPSVLRKINHGSGIQINLLPDSHRLSFTKEPSFWTRFVRKFRFWQ